MKAKDPPLLDLQQDLVPITATQAWMDPIKKIFPHVWPKRVCPKVVSVCLFPKFLTRLSHVKAGTVAHKQIDQTGGATIRIVLRSIPLTVGQHYIGLNIDKLTVWTTTMLKCSRSFAGVSITPTSCIFAHHQLVPQTLSPFNSKGGMVLYERANGWIQFKDMPVFLNDVFYPIVLI